MANSYTSQPIVIDTVMAAGWKAEQAAAATPIFAAAANAVGFRVTKVLWVNPTTVSHTFVIVDSNDATLVLLEGTCGVANEDVPYDHFDPIGAPWRDFKVTTLDSGKLYIWYR